MRPNPHLFNVSYPLELPNRVEGYSDIDISVIWTWVITNIADFVLMVEVSISPG